MSVGADTWSLSSSILKLDPIKDIFNNTERIVNIKQFVKEHAVLKNVMKFGNNADAKETDTAHSKSPSSDYNTLGDGSCDGPSDRLVDNQKDVSNHMLNTASVNKEGLVARVNGSGGTVLRKIDNIHPTADIRLAGGMFMSVGFEGWRD